ncbi:hypothetical protein VspSTUT11_44440 [Vibrio sp. STUT-A11]|nr:hypothetical protein VspSTUT11_44440 [Vibrio sp. STUT-A11]
MPLFTDSRIGAFFIYNPVEKQMLLAIQSERLPLIFSLRIFIPIPTFPDYHNSYMMFIEKTKLTRRLSWTVKN